MSLNIDLKCTMHALALSAAILLLCTHIRRYFEIHKFKTAHRCKPVVRAPQAERMLGLSEYQRLRRIRREHTSLQETERRALEIGRTYSIVVLGQEVVSTCDPENIKTFMATRFADYEIGPRLEATEPLIGKGIFNLDDEPWQHSRALIRPGFTRAQVSDLSSLETHVQALISCVPNINGTTVDLQPLFFNLTIDNATDFLLGQPVRCQGCPPDSAARRFSDAFDYGLAALHHRTELGYFTKLFRDRKFDEACKYVHQYIDDYIHEALKGSTEPGRYNLLVELAKTYRDPVKIRSELLNVLLAARDTTAALLSGVFYLLAKNPDSLNTLRKEVAELGGQLPTYETLKDMRYMKSVLKETLRLLPPLPINLQYARTDTVLPHGGGPDGLAPIYIAKGTRLFCSVWAMHRLPEIWGHDSGMFRPERWMDDEVPLRPGWGYIPFNAGPRMCLGQHNALVEAGYVVARLLQVFDRIESRDPLPWQERLALVLSSEHGTKIALWKML